MTIKTCKTYWTKIYICGDINVARHACREQALTNPPGDPRNCVTIEPADYVYTGGMEAGYVVGLVNYPRFPSTKAKIFNAAIKLAELLIERTFQHSALVMAPDKTVWMTRRKDQ